MTDNKKDPRQNEAATHEAEKGKLYIDPETDGFYYIDAKTGQKVFTDDLQGLKLGDILPPESIKKALDDAISSVMEAFSNNGMVDLERLSVAVGKMRENMARFEALLNEIDTLKPYLLEELQKPEYNGATINDLLNDVEMDGIIPPGCPLEKALQAARAIHEAEPRIIEPIRADSVDYPVDKPNGRFWDGLHEAKDNQITMLFDMANDDDKKRDVELQALFSVDFNAIGDDLQLTRKITPFDKRVYIAAAALYNAGNDILTLTQISYAMGNTGRPSDAMLKKIDDSLTKMELTGLHVDNKPEAQIYDYPHFKYDSTLLPMERVRAIVNHKITDAAIHLFREPPLVSFAKQRKQVTTISIKVLQSGGRKTDDNLRIEDYLIERISREKRTAANAKTKKPKFEMVILLKTLYERAAIKAGKQRQRAPEKIRNYLDYYVECGFIDSYKMDKERVTITAKPATK